MSIESLNNRYSRKQTLESIKTLEEVNINLRAKLLEIYSIVGGEATEDSPTIIETIKTWKASHAKVKSLEAELEELRQTP